MSIVDAHQSLFERRPLKNMLTACSAARKIGSSGTTFPDSVEAEAQAARPIEQQIDSRLVGD